MFRHRHAPTAPFHPSPPLKGWLLVVLFLLPTLILA